MEAIHGARSVLLSRLHNGPAFAFFIVMLVLVIGPRLAERLRLPAMVGLVLAGMAVGPHAFKVLPTKEIALTEWGTFGLLYLMFAAGLELDLRLFMRMKRAAITFATLSFAIPLVLGIIAARYLGYAWAAAVLMGSNWASHTLITYPMLRTMGLSRNRAVGTVVAATAATDTAALLVLTGVVAKVKGSGSLAMQGIEIAIGLAALVVWTLVALPKIARWFFARVGTDRSYRFVFGMAALLSGAVLAQLASIDGIVGAFFAGLGVNRAIPEESPLMERVQFFGATLFIPIFLVSVGTMLDPSVLVEPHTIKVALIFAVAVLGGKTLAAIIAGRIFRFNHAEIGVMSGLSGSQAAATLATVLVGAKIGLFDTATINAVLVVILISLVITPALVTHFGKQLTPERGQASEIGRSVLVPVVGESSKLVLTLAGRLATTDNGMVIAAGFADEDASEADVEAARGLVKRAEEWLGREGLESRSLFHLSRSLEVGIFQAMRGQSATLLVAEWRTPDVDQLSEANDAFRLAMRSCAPVLLVHGDIEHIERLFIVVRQEDLVREARRDLDVALEVGKRLARHHRVVIVGAANEAFPENGKSKDRRHPIERVGSDDPMAWVRENAVEGRDLVVVAGVEGARTILANASSFARLSFVAVLAAHGAEQGATPMEEEHVLAGPEIPSGV